MKEGLVYVVAPLQTEKTQKSQEPTLTESLGDKDLSLRRKQARDLIDKIEIPLEQKRLLFFYHLWHETGSFGSIKEFGDIREDAAVFTIRNRVLESDELVLQYENFYEKYLDLTKQNQEKPIRKRRVYEEKPGKKIVKMLEKGIGVEDAVSKLEISIDLEEKGNTAKERFFQFCSKVELINDPLLSDKEIALILKSTQSRVKRARKRLRLTGKQRKRTPMEISRANSRRLIPLRNQVRNLAGDMLLKDIAKKTGATISQVKLQKEILVKSGEIPQNSTRIQRKEIFKKLISEFMISHKGEKINLSKIYREAGLGISYSLIQSLFQEIKNEQEVPALSNNHLRTKH